MPVFDVKCTICGYETEEITIHAELDEGKLKCRKCGGVMKKIVPQKSPSFNLKYNNQTDMCDWNGNTSRYWDAYKEAKARGEDVRLPKHDGDE